MAFAKARKFKVGNQEYLYTLRHAKVRYLGNAPAWMRLIVQSADGRTAAFTFLSTLWVDEDYHGHCEEHKNSFAPRHIRRVFEALDGDLRLPAGFDLGTWKLDPENKEAH